MIGVVGKIEIKYQYNGELYTELFDAAETTEYKLNECSQCAIIVDEVMYIEDTVYGVTLLLEDEEYYVAKESVEFISESLGVKGTFKLIYM